MNLLKKVFFLLSLLLITILISGCEEKQNKINRYVQNWTGVNGVLDIYAGDKLIKRY